VPVISTSNPSLSETYDDTESLHTTTKTDLKSPNSEAVLEVDLQTINAAWPNLPEHIRAAILMLVGTVKP